MKDELLSDLQRAVGVLSKPHNYQWFTQLTCSLSW